VFLSGVLSALLELDRTPHQPTRTPLGHSLPAAAAWSFLLCALAAGLSPDSLQGAALASISAFSSHLALDALTAEGVFLWPEGIALEDWLQPYPPGALIEHRGRHYLILDGSGGLGAEPWSGWRRLSLTRVRDGSFALNAPISAAGLVAIVLAVALS